MTTYGRKYHETEHLDIAEVAKLVRADIKAAQAGLPALGLTYSTRIERYSLGKAIGVTVLGLADADHFTPNEYGRMTLTPAAQQIENTLKAILAAYNYDNSDSMADYHEVRFAAEVDIQTEEDAAAVQRYRDQQATRRARRAVRS